MNIMKNTSKVLKLLLVMASPGLFIIFYPKINMDFGLLIFFVIFFTSVIHTFNFIKNDLRIN